MDRINLLGLTAGCLTTLAFIPQVVKIWRTRSAEDISTMMFMLFSSGVFLWLVYGVAIDALPVILANGVTLVLALAVLILKFRYRPRTAK